VTTLATKSGISIPPSELEDWSALLSGRNHCAKEILTLEDYAPTVDLCLYPRTNIHRPVGPADTDHGGWAWKFDVRAMKPKSDELAGRTIAIKDNIAVAGVKCTNGTGGKVGDWVPKVDATLVTRLLDAGGVIKGKAACENNCFGAVRYAQMS
jgi:amidase